MIFIMTGLDKPDSLELRKATRPKHLEWIAQLGARVKLGGPMLGPDGNPIGSVIFLEAGSQREAEALYAEDPYRHAGLWEHVDIKPFSIVAGGFK